MKKIVYLLIFLVYPSFAGAWGILQTAVNRVENNKGAPYLIEKINSGEPIKVMLFYPESGLDENAVFNETYGAPIEQNIRRAVGQWQSAVINTIAKLPADKAKQFSDISAAWNRKDLLTFVEYGKGYADLRVNVYINGENFTGCQPGALACASAGEHLQYIYIAFDPEEAERTDKGLGFYDAFLHEFGHSLGLSDQGYADSKKNHSVLYVTPNDAQAVMTAAARSISAEVYIGEEDDNDPGYIQFKQDFQRRHNKPYPRGGYHTSSGFSFPVSPDDVEGIIALSDVFRPAKEKPARFINGWESFVRKDTYYMESKLLRKEAYDRIYADKLNKGLLAETPQEESLKKEIQSISSEDIRHQIAGLAPVALGKNTASLPASSSAKPSVASNLRPAGIIRPSERSSKKLTPRAEAVSAPKLSSVLPVPVRPSVSKVVVPSIPLVQPDNTLQRNSSSVAVAPVCSVCGKDFSSGDKYEATASRLVHKHSMCAYKYFARRFPTDAESLKSYDASYSFSIPSKVTAARGLMGDLGITSRDIKRFADQENEDKAAQLAALSEAKKEREEAARVQDQQPKFYQQVKLEDISSYAAENKDILKSIRTKNKVGKPLSSKETRVLNRYQQMYKNFELTKKYSMFHI